jgi:hypothetical protein
VAKKIQSALEKRIARSRAPTEALSFARKPPIVRSSAAVPMHNRWSAARTRKECQSIGWFMEDLDRWFS